MSGCLDRHQDTHRVFGCMSGFVSRHVQMPAKCPDLSAWLSGHPKSVRMFVDMLD